MTPQLLPAVRIEPRRPAERAVIWLHGLGADGHDFEPVVPVLGIGDELLATTRFVFPHAPRIPVTLNGGMVMPAWYDIAQLDLGRGHDQAGIRRSAQQVADLIEHEARQGIPAERVVLAGFSQGGAIALHAGARQPARLAGIVALSCYLVAADALDREATAAGRATPIFQAHGARDPMVPVAAGKLARDRLRALGFDVAWREYPLQHEVSLEELRDVGAFLRGCLSDGAAPGGR